MSMKNYSIHVNKNEVFSWITAGKKTVQTMRDGKTGPLDPRLLHQMERAADQIEKSASARYIYNVFELIREEEGPISLKGSSLRLPGKDIASLLKECSRCILLTVTIGGTVDRILRRAQISDMADAVLLDFCASSAAEDLCGRIHSDLEEEYEKKGLYLTDRFSPGYGDLPIGLQSEICRVLQTDKRLGLTVNSGNMLIPSKSITAVIGISHRPQPQKISGCANCKMKDTCKFRKAGTTCE